MVGLVGILVGIKLNDGVHGFDPSTQSNPFFSHPQPRNLQTEQATQFNASNLLLKIIIRKSFTQLSC
jgi:hypothetical protein